jgi:UDP-3-O-[3-hydroxymyristoyl] glucosamine N-acyltransferase
MNSSNQARPTPISIEELAQCVQATLHGSSEVLISGLSHLEGATYGDLSFVLKPKFHEAARNSHAAAFLTTHPIPDDPRPQLICPNTMLAVVRLAEKYFSPPLPQTEPKLAQESPFMGACTLEKMPSLAMIASCILTSPY